MHRALTAAGLLVLCLIFAFTALRADDWHAAGSRPPPSWAGIAVDASAAR